MNTLKVQHKLRCLYSALALGICTQAFAGDVSQQMMNMRFSLTDYLSYYGSQWLQTFINAPWVVRVSYLGVLLCGIIILVYAIGIFHLWRVRRRNEKFYKKIHEYYHDSVSEVLADKTELSIEEVAERTRYNEADSKLQKESWKSWQMWQVGRLMMDAKSDNYEDYNMSNLNVLVKMFGFGEFIDKQLAYTVGTNPVKALQFAQFLAIKVPESSLVRLLNSKDINTRKETRMYHMLMDEYNPFRFFEENTVDYEYRKWDDLEIHHLLSSRQRMNKPIPSLMSLILLTEDVNLKSCLIREVAYWGNKKDVRRMEKYFTGKEIAFRRAAIQCMAIAKNKECEKDLISSFVVQPEELRQEIIKTIYQIRSGESADFFPTAYKQTVSQTTKYTALYFMYMYSLESRIMFGQLESEETEKNRLTFDQVRTYISLTRRNIA